MALDLMLKTFLASPEFSQMPDKNWANMARLIPGTTPRQCQKRYEELLKEQSAGLGSYSLSLTRVNNAGSASFKPAKNDTDTGSEVKGSRPSSAKVKGAKPDKDSTAGKPVARPDSGDQGPVMVIHVCDEAKNLKQDFHCARDLLVREMKYFAEYLSTDAQRWEEVDISVHCDVQIFDWLMRHVKRGTREVNVTPKLEPNNVISILISSDFLKMENLVRECVEFCHKNMSAIVATPCNMNCINDRLVSQIADLFNHNEADEVKDRKDKFKSKLFAKMVEKLFDPNTKNQSTPENASTLYRCSICKKVLTKNIETQVKCLPSRMVVSRDGDLGYHHTADPSWDVNEYLVELKAALKTWRDVYWRLWGTVNVVRCARCGETVPCVELGQCRYHSETADFTQGSDTGQAAAVGRYLCCGVEVLRFDPTQPNRGCKVRDHVVSLPAQDSPELTSDPRTTERVQVYNDLLAHRDAVCLPSTAAPPPPPPEDSEPNVFAPDELLACSKLRDDGRGLLESPAPDDTAKTETNTQPKPRLQALTIERQVSYDDEFGFGESDDEIGDEEETGKAKKPRVSKRVTVDPQAILLDAPDFSTTKLRKWDTSRSMRWNQDAQREEDQRRMKEIVTYLTRLRISGEKMDKLKSKEYAGGLFAKLDAQWKAANAQPPKPTSQQLRNKPRLSQLVNK